MCALLQRRVALGLPVTIAVVIVVVVVGVIVVVVVVSVVVVVVVVVVLLLVVTGSIPLRLRGRSVELRPGRNVMLALMWPSNALGRGVVLGLSPLGRSVVLRRSAALSSSPLSSPSSSPCAC